MAARQAATTALTYYYTSESKDGDYDGPIKEDINSIIKLRGHQCIW